MSEEDKKIFTLYVAYKYHGKNKTELEIGMIGDDFDRVKLFAAQHGFVTDWIGMHESFPLLK